MRPFLCPWAFLLSASLAWAAAPSAPAAPADSSPAAIAKLLKQLGDDDWQVREAAADALKAIGKPALEPMLTEYRRTKDAEVRARLPEIARQYFWKEHAGFLGVSMQTDNAGVGILIRDVLEDTAAKKGGLERGDTIISFNGQPVGNITEIRNFSKLVLGRGQGIPTKIVVIRDTGERVERTVTLGRLPEDGPSGWLSKLDSVDPADLAQFDEWWAEQVRNALPPQAAK